MGSHQWRVFAYGLLLALVVSVASRTTLYIGGFFPTSRDVMEGAIGRGVLPAMELALNHINNSPRVLRGYHLDVYWNDTKCDAAVGMKAFFDMLSKKPHKVMLFGAACTSVTDPIAKASQFFELVQVSYADTHPMYTSESYPNFFRVVPSESAFNPARVALLRRFNWTRVGTLFQNTPRYALPHSKLLSDLDSAEIQIAETQSFNEELQNELLKLKEHDVRIILGNFNESWARRIFCEAFRVGMYGRRYQWVIVGMYQERWWKYLEPGISCSVMDLETALEGYLATDVLPLSFTTDVTVSGLTPAEYEAQYDRSRKKDDYSRFHGYTYDGIWAIALALQSVARKLRSLATGFSLKDFDYRDPFWGKLFREAFNETSFTGVTGPVTFMRNERRGLILVKQFQKGEEVKVGEYDSIAEYLDLSKGSSILWRGSTGPPMDRTLKVIVGTRVSITIYSILCTFAVLGICLATFFLIINIKYRNQKYIKMSSPYLNNVIVVGCMLTYTSVILLGLDSGLTSEANFPYICAARAWVLMSGFTLAFGSMFSKTWRVHAIFTNIKINKKVIKDYQLFILVGVLVLIDVVILTTWQIVDPFYRETTYGIHSVSPENEDIEIIPEMEFCRSSKMTIFLGTIYAYKGLLMAFGCFLAWETRHVNIPALNDSKYVGMSVYNIVIMCVIGAAISYVLHEQQDAAFIIISIFIIFCSTTTLCLVFVPKVLELWKNPLSGDKRVRAALKPLGKMKRDSDEEEESSFYSKIRNLQDQNHHYKTRLNECNLELQALQVKSRESDEYAPIHERPSPIIEDSREYESRSEEVSEIEQSKESLHQRSFRIKIVNDPRDKPQVSFREPLVSSEPVDEPSGSCPDLTRRAKPLSSPTLQLKPSSLLDQVYVESESSESQSPTGHIQESDDTSYGRAIKNAHRSSLVNGLSSSCDEDTDRCELATVSEESDSNQCRCEVRRRTKSLGTIRVMERGTSTVSSLPTTSLYPPLFPYFTNLSNEESSPRSSHLYSSYPSIKCDIIEYL